MQMTPPLWQKWKKKKVKEESEKVGLKLNIQKTKIMESGPNTLGQIDGETVTDFILGALKSLQMVTAAMKLKMLAPWKKSYDQPRQYIEKQRRYFDNKDPSHQSYGFPVVMYRCESWMIKLSTKELMLLNCGVGRDS